MGLCTEVKMEQEKINDESNDVLNEIFVDKNEPTDKKMLVEILKPFVTIDSEGTISFSEKYDNLDEMKKALVYLTCRKAIVLRNIENVTEPAGPAEVSQKAMINSSSAKNALCTRYKNILKKEKDGYIIPSYNLKKVKELIFKKETKT